MMILAYLAFAIGLVVSVLYLGVIHAPQSLFRSAAKTLPLLAFTLASYLSGAPAFLTAALFLSALGDLALSRTGRAAFLYGLCSFALAHLVFIILFQSLGGGAIWQAFSIAPLIALVLLVISASTELWLAPFTGGLRWPVRIYVALITLMGLAALALPPAFGLVVIGAALFILSDMILSIRLFRLAEDDPSARAAAVALWVSYIAGQAMIVLGIAAF